MKTKILSLSLAGLLAVQSVALAQSSRLDGIGEAPISAAQKELSILRYDLARLQEALDLTARSVKARQENGNLAAVFSVSTAALGLGLAALSPSVRKAGVSTGAGEILSMAAMAVAAIKTSSSTALMLVSELQKGGGSTRDARHALSKARQEISAARAGGTLDSEALSTLAVLEASFKSMEANIEEYTFQRRDEKGLRFTAMLTQAMGVALTFYAGAGLITTGHTGRAAPFLGPLLMSVGNIAQTATVLTSSDATQVLAEIDATRIAIAQASAALTP